MKDTTRTSRPEGDGDIHWMLRDADEMESPAHSSVRLMSMKKKSFILCLKQRKHRETEYWLIYLQ